jgi:hypothetical protein
MRDRLRCRSIPSPAVRERGDRPRSGWWERVARIGAASYDESAGFRTGTGSGSALVKLDAVECSVGDGAGDFCFGKSHQNHGARRVACRGCAATGTRLGRRARGRPATEVPVALRSPGSARTGMSGPGRGFSEEVAPWMAGNRGPCVAQRSPRSLDSVFRTSSTDPGWAFPGPAVMRAAACHRQVGRASPSKGTNRSGSLLRGIAVGVTALQTPSMSRKTEIS